MSSDDPVGARENDADAGARSGRASESDRQGDSGSSVGPTGPAGSESESEFGDGRRSGPGAVSGSGPGAASGPGGGAGGTVPTEPPDGAGADGSDGRSGWTGRGTDTALGRVSSEVRERAAGARRHRRRTIAGFVAVGGLALAGGVVFPGVRGVMFTLGGTGLFAALLVATLVPSRPVPTAVGREVYGALGDAGGSLVGELGLTDERVYVPVARGESAVRLFVPQAPDYRVPVDAIGDRTLVVTDDRRERGLSIRPTGDALFVAYADALPDGDGASPAAAAEQLVEALTEEFGLVRSAGVEVAGADRVEVRVVGSTYGPVDGFDHPVPSFVATGLARRLDRAVRLDAVDRDGDGGWTVVCAWEPAD